MGAKNDRNSGEEAGRSTLGITRSSGRRLTFQSPVLGCAFLGLLTAGAYPTSGTTQNMLLFAFSQDDVLSWISAFSIVSSTLSTAGLGFYLKLSKTLRDDQQLWRDEQSQWEKIHRASVASQLQAIQQELVQARALAESRGDNIAALVDELLDMRKKIASLPCAHSPCVVQEVRERVKELPPPTESPR